MTDSSPVELYKFVEGVNVFTQTRGANLITYLAEDYLPYSITRTQVEAKDQLFRANLDLTLAIDNPVAARYLAAPIDAVVTLTLYIQRNGTTDVFWKGRLSNVKASGTNVFLSFESVFTSMRRPGLRARAQRNCRHTLYGRGCFLDPEDFAVSVDVTDVSANLITVSDISASILNKYRGGMIRAPDTTLRYIVQSDPSVGVLTLVRSFDTLEAAFIAGGSVPMAVTIYPGCAHNRTACLNDFNNLKNYGGFPWWPAKNPMDGTAIT